MLNNFVNFDFLFTKLSGIDPCEKHNYIPGGHAWRHFFMACSKLQAMAIYLVKQACGNDQLACVYQVPTEAVKKSKMLFTILWYTVDKLKFMYVLTFAWSIGKSWKSISQKCKVLFMRIKVT